MGQYYRAYLEADEPDRYEVFRPWCGAKLCEIAFCDLSFVNLVFNRLINRPMHLAFIGDYANDKDDKWGGYNHSGYMLRYDRAYGDEAGANAIVCMEEEEARKVQEQVKDISSAYVVNKSRKEFISLRDYKRLAEKYYPKAYVMHPLVILTACGNGRGGGDYYTNDEDLYASVGKWAFDVIEIVLTQNMVNSTYKDVTEDYIFAETM